jgi:hypothetical protein
MVRGSKTETYPENIFRSLLSSQEGHLTVFSFQEKKEYKELKLHGEEKMMKILDYLCIFQYFFHS